jgi:hypothetical protein
VEYDTPSGLDNLGSRGVEMPLIGNKNPMIIVIPNSIA